MISKQEPPPSQPADDADDEHERPATLSQPWECVAHLKLLAAFTYLRDEISQTQDLFFKDAEFPATAAVSASSTEPERQRQQLIEEKRWTIYIARAVKRFERWFKALRSESAGVVVTARTCTTKGALQRIVGEAEAFVWSADTLPPLDVLMVLHSFMLNPRWFLDDCLRLGMVPLWKAGMPWDLVNKVLEEPELVWTASEAARNNFTSKTGLAWDNLANADADLFSCAVCEGSKVSAEECGSDDWLLHDEFTLLCSLPCRDVRHLRAVQFLQLLEDIQAFDDSKRPLKMSILTADGLAESQPASSLLRSPPANLFTSRLLSLVDRKVLHDQTQRAKKGDDPSANIPSFFDNIKEQSTRKSSKLRTAKSNPLSSTLSPGEVYSFNRTRLAYSESTGPPSPFSIDLAGAVLRQGKFVAQMSRDIDWLHGPGLASTMCALIDKYDVFVDIMRRSQRHEVSVPTLAVDLAWHTQQLSPERYYAHCLRYVNGVFVDHDDRIGEGDLEVAFKRTRDMFGRITEGEEDYSECLCWSCAAMNERGFDAEDFKGGKGAEELERMRTAANEDVKKAQLRKISQDYDRYCRRRRRRGREGEAVGWEEYVDGYKWPQADSIPSKDDLMVVLSQR